MTVTQGSARSLRSRLGIAAVPLLLALGAASCGDDDDAGTSQETESTAEPTSTVEPDYGGSGGAATGDGATLTISGFRFSDATVKPGAEVAVTNEDDVPHTATADDESFDSGRLDGGGAGTFTAPSEPGTYAFHCEVHPDMQGTLTVEA